MKFAAVAMMTVAVWVGLPRFAQAAIADAAEKHWFALPFDDAQFAQWAATVESDDLRVLVNVALDDFTASLDVAGRPAFEAYLGFVDAGNDRGLRETGFEWQVRRQPLELEFERNLQLLVGSECLEGWLVRRRALRRESVLREINRAVAPRVVADYVPVFASAGPQTADVLSEYEQILDHEFVAWERSLPSGLLAITRSDDKEARSRRGAQFQETINGIIQAAREINRSFFPRLLEVVSDEDHDRIVGQIGQIEYPTLYVTSPVEHAFELLSSPEAGGLRPEIEQIAIQYRSQLAALRRRMIKAIKAWASPDLARERERAYAAGATTYQVVADHPINELLGARLDLESETSTRLRRVLGDDISPAVRLCLFTRDR